MINARPLGALLVAATLAACSGTEPAPVTTTTEEAVVATPSPTPTFEIRPVVGERAFALFDVSSSEILGTGPRVGVDEARSNAAMVAIGDWLDRHLDSLQRGEGGDLATVSVDPATVDVSAVTTGLTSPDAPVAAATYTISSYDDGGPEWLTAEVRITHPDDRESTTTMVFDLLDGDGLQLVLAGPETDAEPEDGR